MRSLTSRRPAAFVALAAITVFSGRELDAQAPNNSRFDALVSLTEVKMKEFGVPGRHRHH